jgi:5-methylthioadenosine/S-adenosylhomocysteine deaminase
MVQRQAKGARDVPDLLIRHAEILTLDDAGSAYRDADIAIRDGLIVALGPAPLALPPDFAARETLDLTDHLVIPGFVNAHTHAPMVLLRSSCDDMPIAHWFNEGVWVLESGLTPEDVRWGALLAVAEMVRGGTTTFADHYFEMDAVAEAAITAGIRALLAWAVFGLGSEAEAVADLGRTEAFVRQWHGAEHGLIRTTLGPHSPYICPEPYLRLIAERAQRLGTGLHIHVAETWEQTNASLANHGKTPVQYLDDCGIFSVPTIAAHCVGVTDADIALLAARGVHVVHCPTVAMKLATGAAPVPAMLAAGVNVALGTDGAASNNDLSLLGEAQVAKLLHVHTSGDATILPGDTCLRMATRSGARATGFGQCGVLALGMAADLIAFDQRRPHLRPRTSHVGNILYAAQGADVDTVIVAGRVIMRKGELLTLDEERIISEAERRGLALIARGRTLDRGRTYDA